jgi:cobalamin biosynthesis protein CobW
MNSPAMSHAKIPATVVTGFLGAGKTTLVRHLLATSGRRIALIVNEFGEVGVDRELLLGCGDATCTDDDIVELANGCICCTVADDFLPTMRKLLDRPNPPEHIVIETSGLALPKPLIKAFGWPEVRNRVTVDGVVAVVDSAAVRDGLFASDPVRVEAQRRGDTSIDHETPLEELFEEQLGSADLVVLNKSDLLGDADWATVDSAVREHLRAGVRTVRATNGTLPAAVALGMSAQAEDDLASRPSHHDDGSDHEHDDFESFHIDLPPVTDIEVFTTRLRDVARRHALLRVKGFLAMSGRPMRLAIQGVGDRVQHYFDRPWQPGEAAGSRLVVIGERGLDREAITAALVA